MPFEEVGRLQIENTNVVQAFERLENIECELEDDEEILYREREIAWGMLRATYPEFNIDDSAYYEYDTNELVLLKEINSKQEIQEAE